MPARSGPTSNVLAGGFLLAGVVLAIVISFVLMRALDRAKPSHYYTVIFSVADGAAGIKPGSEVLLGGQAVGRVDRVPLDPKDGLITHIPVKIRIRKDLVLHRDAVVHLERPLLGSLSTINIASLGTPDAEVIPPDGTVGSQVVPPPLLAQAGYGSAQAEEVKQIITFVKKTAERVSQILDRNAENLAVTLDQTSKLVSQVNQHAPQWTADLDLTLKNAAAGSQDFTGFMADARGLLQDNRSDVRQIVTDAREITSKVNGESIESFNTTLAQAQSALDTFTRVVSKAGALVGEESPNIRKALDNARLASDQLKLAAIEIRSQPWRIFYKPTLKETETSVLYDSARAYATAASDLRAASESLESAINAAAAPGNTSKVDPALLQDLTTQLKERFAKYKEAEKSLLDRLISHGGGSAAPPPDSSRGTPRVNDGK